jgi:hypothetical protein
MSIRSRFFNFLFPPSPWRGCHAPTEYQRMADYERRVVKYWLDFYEQRAKEWERLEGVAQSFDARATVRPAFRPRLPQDRNVLPFHRHSITLQSPAHLAGIIEEKRSYDHQARSEGGSSETGSNGSNAGSGNRSSESES